MNSHLLVNIVEPILKPEAQADDGRMGIPITISQHKAYGRLLHEINSVLCASIRKTGRDPQIKNKIKVQNHLIKLKSLMEDIMFSENRELPDDALTVYYPGFMVEVKHGGD